MKAMLAAAILLASVAGARATPTPNSQGVTFLEKLVQNDMNTYLTGGSSLFNFEEYSGLDVKLADAMMDAALGAWFSGGPPPSFVKTDNSKRALFFFYLIGRALPAKSPCLRALAVESKCRDVLKPGKIVTKATYRAAYPAYVALLHLPADPALTDDDWETPTVSPTAVAIPHYDVDGICARHFPRAINAKSCVEAEQGAYDWVRIVWEEVSESTKELCLRQAAYHQPRPYGYLEACIEPHLELERTQRQGPFRYGGR